MTWVILLIISALTPGIMLLCGQWFLHRPPEYGSPVGYRSKQSLLSEQAWYAAHAVCGRLWFRLGEALLMFTVLVMIAVHNLDAVQVGVTASVLMLIQVGVMLLTLPITEHQLKQRFDEHGKPRT